MLRPCRWRDGFGIGGDDGFNGHHRRQRIQIAEDVFTAAQADHTGDDLPAAHGRERLLPDLVEGAHHGLPAVACLQIGEARAVVSRRGVGDFFGSGQPADALDLARARLRGDWAAVT